MIKHEISRLGSRHRDGSPMYPGEWVLTWFKAPFMPWVLLAIEPAANVR